MSPIHRNLKYTSYWLFYNRQLPSVSTPAFMPFRPSEKLGWCLLSCLKCLYISTLFERYFLENYWFSNTTRKLEFFIFFFKNKKGASNKKKSFYILLHFRSDLSLLVFWTFFDLTTQKHTRRAVKDSVPPPRTFFSFKKKTPRTFCLKKRNWS